jgi:hypothetical protein
MSNIISDNVFYRVSQLKGEEIGIRIDVGNESYVIEVQVFASGITIKAVRQGGLKLQGEFNPASMVIQKLDNGIYIRPKFEGATVVQL